LRAIDIKDLSLGLLPLCIIYLHRASKPNLDILHHICSYQKRLTHTPSTSYYLIVQECCLSRISKNSYIYLPHLSFKKGCGICVFMLFADSVRWPLLHAPWMHENHVTRQQNM